MKTSIPVLLLAVAAAACGYKPALQPDQTKQPPYVFPHSIHADAGVACTSCHDVSKATTLDPAVRHVQIPQTPSKQKACSDCHDKDPKPKIPARTRAFRVNFSHADHLARVGGDCRKCHVSQPEVNETDPRTPPMATCTACHVHQKAFAEARCRPCHVDLKGYKPETAFRHEGSWLAVHGTLARSSGESCAQCHDQTYCAGCHSAATAPARLENIFPERVDRGFIHRGDYVSRHMIDAGANPASCRRCHGSAFCDACHAANGLSAVTGLPRPGGPHPAGWATLPPSDGGPHKNAARRDIASCAACHDGAGAQQTCVVCHGSKVGGFRVNPHPTKFLTSHDLGDTRENGMCRTCH
ncbi:MAG TPA: cytochrome c3 family protein [Anaeromyxobacter sp.]